MGTNKNRTKIQKVKGWAHISEVLAEYKFMSKPTRKQLEEQAKAAFQEYLMSSHLVGLRIAYKISDQMWEDFYRFLEWRWDRLYEPKEARHNKKSIQAIQARAGSDLELPKDYLFIKIPKTATASINEFAKQYAGHRTAAKWRRHYSREAWDNLFKFTIVRNPYDRFQSSYYHANLQATDINEWLATKGVEEARKLNPQVFMKQVEFIYDDRGILLVDYVGKFEELDKAWEHIKSKTGLKGELPHKHDRRDQKRVKLNKKSKEIIYQYYKDDFEKLGYDK